MLPFCSNTKDQLFGLVWVVLYIISISAALVDNYIGRRNSVEKFSVYTHTHTIYVKYVNQTLTKIYKEEKLRNI